MGRITIPIESRSIFKRRLIDFVNYMCSLSIVSNLNYKHFKTMKKGESLMTETTKQSLIQVSSNNIKTLEFVKVFIQLENRTFSINVPL